MCHAWLCLRSCSSTYKWPRVSILSTYMDDFDIMHNEKGVWREWKASCSIFSPFNQVLRGLCRLYFYDKTQRSDGVSGPSVLPLQHKLHD